jgi:methionine aminotransferase
VNNCIKSVLKHLRSKFPQMGTTIFSVMSALAAEHNALNLAQGFPEFDCSMDLKELVYQAMLNGANQYAPMPGLMALRQVISDKVRLCQEVEYNPHTEITVTAGATQAIFTAIACLVNPGDEVLFFEPAYDCYVPAIEAFGGVPVPIALRFPEYEYDWELVKKHLSDKTRLLILNSPNNPCGKVLTQSDISQISILADSFPFFILSDEVYEHLVFDGRQHLSVCKSSELKSRSFIVSSFGKSYHNTGWKIGYVLGPELMMNEFRKIHQYLVFSVHHPSQVALAEFLKNADSYLSLPSFYQKKRDLFLRGIDNTGWKPLKTEGTYFQLLKIPDGLKGPDESVARELTIRYKLASIPVSAFYSDKTDHRVLRFCFAKNDDTLLKATEILSSIPLK